MGDEPNHQGSSRRWLVTELDNSLRRLGVDHVDLYQIHRWDPTTSDEETLSALTDLQRAGKIRYFGSSTFPAYRIVAGAVGRPGAPPGPLRHRAAGLLDPAARHRDPRAAGHRGVRPRGPGLEPAGLGLALRGHPRGAGRSPPAGPTVVPDRFDLTLPANQARMEAVEQLAVVAEEAGLTMIQLALGFVTAHPAVTSAIIGPRTLDHLRSQLAAADTVLSADVLDAIDAIVAPGLDLAPEEKYDTPPSLLDPALRRR